MTCTSRRTAARDGRLPAAPSFARPLVPKVTALQRDLVQYLDYHNFERAHTGQRNAGRIPAVVVYGARKMRPK